MKDGRKIKMEDYALYCVTLFFLYDGRKKGGQRLATKTMK